MAETPEQRRLRRLGEQEAANSVRSMRSPTPEPAGLGDQPDPRLRNEGGSRPLQSSRAHGFSQRAVDALDRARNFTSAAGSLTQGPLEAQARPRAVGGVLAAGLGASELAMNAARVYDQSEGDIGETARQVAFDLPPAIGGTLGAIAGGTLGRRSPAASSGLTVAGGGLGYTGGQQIASGISRLAGGSGLSPLQERQNAQPVDNTTYVSPANPDIPMLPEYGGVPVDARTGLPVQTATPTPAPTVAPAATQAVPETPAQAMQQQVLGAPQASGYGQVPGVPGVVGRTGRNGVPEFTNEAAAVQGAQGEFTAGGRLGDGRGTFSVGAPGDAALASQRFERANEIRRQGRLSDLQERQIGEQRRLQQTMAINANRAEYLLRSGRPNDRREAALLMRQNEALAGQMEGSRTTEQAVALGRENADVQRERTATLGEGVRAQTALARQQLAQEREAARRTSSQADSREEIAGRNAETFNERVEGLFSEVDPESGEARVPAEAMSLITERAPAYAQQREAALRESIAALTARADSDPRAAAQLQQAQADYDRFIQDVYRVDSEGNPVELRPVREWSEDNVLPFFTDVRAQRQLQAGREGTILPELGGAAAGALAGARLGARGGSVGARLGGAVVGGALGALGGTLGEDVVRGQQSRVPQGAQNASPTLAANTDRVYTSRGNVIATLRDGSVVNLRDLVYDNQGRRTSANAPVIQAQFDALLSQLRSNDPTARTEAQQALEVFSDNDDLVSFLSDTQRSAMRRQGLGE